MKRLIMASVVVTCLALALAACGGANSSGERRSSATDKTPDTTIETDPTPTEPAPDPAPEPALAIVIDTPLQFEPLVGSFVLSGRAKVAQGALRWSIDDANGKPLAQGSMTASCSAPCMGTYRTKVSLAKVKLGSWELHVWSSPPDSSESRRTNDIFIPVVVAKERIPGAPPADAAPPGGTPQDLG